MSWTTPMTPFPATEREWVIRDVSRRVVRRYAIPEHVSRADLLEAIKDVIGSSGSSTWTGLEPDHDSPEFWNEDGRVRSEWTERPYHARYQCESRGVYVGFLYPKRKPEITWGEITDAVMALAHPPAAVQASFLDAVAS